MFTPDYNFFSVRDAAILTTSYVAGQVLGEGTQDSGNAELRNQLTLYVSFTKGSLTTAELIIEFSNDEITWFQETYDDIAASTGIITERPIVRTFAASGNFRIPLPITDRYIRVSVKGTGTVTSSSMTVGAIIGVN